MPFTQEPKLGALFQMAMNEVMMAHSCQVRKIGKVPYIAHLMGTASLVLEAGGDEEEAVAALFHDWVEDIASNPKSGIKVVQPFNYLSCRYGENVGAMVIALTEKKGHPRVKELYVNEIEFGDDSVILISAADKLHNLRSYATDARELWKPETAKFYAMLMPVYEKCERVPRYWIVEMKELLAKLDAPASIYLMDDDGNETFSV